jgi:hypothetical protein
MAVFSSGLTAVLEVPQLSLKTEFKPRPKTVSHSKVKRLTSIGLGLGIGGLSLQKDGAMAGRYLPDPVVQTQV